MVCLFQDMNNERDKRYKKQQHGKKVIERQHKENQQDQLNQQVQPSVAASTAGSSSSSSRHVRSNTRVEFSSAYASDASDASGESDKSDKSDHIAEHETCAMDSKSRSKDVEMQVKSNSTSVPLEIVTNHDIVACGTEIHRPEKKRNNHFEKEGIIKALERYGVHDLLDEEKGDVFGMERLQYTIDDTDNADNADEGDMFHGGHHHHGCVKQRLLFHDCCAPNQGKRKTRNKRTCAQNFSNACPSHLVALCMCITFLVIMSVIALVIVECKEKYKDVEWKIQYLQSSMQNISLAMGIPMQPFVQNNTSLFSTN